MPFCQTKVPFYWIKAPFLENNLIQFFHFCCDILDYKSKLLQNFTFPSAPQFPEKAYPGFDLMTRDSYFTILVEVFMNHILAENTYFMNHVEWTEHKKTTLKFANKYRILWQCHCFKSTLIDCFQHHPFLYQAKVL